MTSTGGDVEPLENLLPCYIELLDKHVKPPSCAPTPTPPIPCEVAPLVKSGCLLNTKRIVVVRTQGGARVLPWETGFETATP